ncbi:hypothetical protein [Actinomadura macrotermitis]|uniref:Gram-positive cocci surface proteins LPxTG domain-containing protein n=1 Tax=Actinomadura macrotermitis TaxID=2585200 RepID=A0A7K0C2E5_9ACTN|nr:hypothetical protein [Actinomadura macrotermitis]MQY07593.1 hypothetical protein [Actinomadura macrotermitis]
MVYRLAAVAVPAVLAVAVAAPPAGAAHGDGARTGAAACGAPSVPWRNRAWPGLRAAVHCANGRGPGGDISVRRPVPGTPAPRLVVPEITVSAGASPVATVPTSVVVTGPAKDGRPGAAARLLAAAGLLLAAGAGAVLLAERRRRGGKADE